MTQTIEEIGHNRLTIKTMENTAILAFEDSIDAETVPEIRESMKVLNVEPYHNYVIDLAKVRFLDSTGVGLFAFMLKNTNRYEGKMIFVGAEGQPRAVLGMVGFDELSLYRDNIEQALNDIRH